MARVKRAVHAKKHHKAVLEQAQGYYGNKSRSFRAANEQVMHSLQYAFRDRRARKGDFRQLWIQRINAAARLHGMSYSRLIAGLRLAEVEVDRKVLADLAVTDANAFAAIVKLAEQANASADGAAPSAPAPAAPAAKPEAAAPAEEPPPAAEPEAAAPAEEPQAAAEPVPAEPVAAEPPAEEPPVEEAPAS
jgi:large subunit ribosomal protein L20